VTTAAYVHPWTRPQTARPQPAGVRRFSGPLREPNAWTVGVVLATSVVLIARHPIARALGTEPTPAVASVSAALPVRPAAGAHLPSLTLPVLAAPTHPPRDPFRALITTGGKVLAPVEGGAVKSSTPTPTPTPVLTPGSCTGLTHRVVAGDTLWSLAARAVRSSGTARVTLAWHRLYADNRAVVGADPGMLRVGESLCVPQSL